MTFTQRIDDAHRAFALPGARDRYGPDKTVEVEEILLTLEPRLAEAVLDGVCTTRMRALDEPVERLAFDAVDLAVSSVTKDGQPQEYRARDGRLEIAFDPILAAGERCEVSVVYRATRPRAGLFFIAPSAAYPHKVAHCWTQSQDENARYWFPCLDYPHSKQPTETTIVVDEGLFALANGDLVERRDEGGKTLFRYRQEIKHSTYLMTMVAGPFEEIDLGTAGAAKVPVLLYALPGRADDARRAFGKTPAMIDLFEERIGTPYPFARYSQIAVSDFIFGGMENTSATTQTDRVLHDERAALDYSADFLAAHELAHQWFGDLLTCRDWAHAWLNEGFATFFEGVWFERDLGYDEYLYHHLGCLMRYLDEDATRYRRPIVCNRFRDPIELFDRHLYEKGAAVLHILRRDLGEARFWRSIRHYVAQNAQRNVETIDLVRAIEESTGRNMRGFFDRWVMKAGHPEIKISASWDAKRSALTISVDQEQPIDDERPPFPFDLPVGLCETRPDRLLRDAGSDAIAGERRLMLKVERQNERFVIPCAGEPQLIRIDPGAAILGKVRFALGASAAANVLAADPDPIARIRAADELVRDEGSAARAALADAFRSEPFWGVLAETARILGATRAPWARDLLLQALEHAHPKVRRAVAEALGNWRESTVADALILRAREDASYLVCAAAAYALGKTRDPRALDFLGALSKQQSWNGTTEAGAVRGLAELADERAFPAILSASELGRDEGLRRAAVAALGRFGELVEAKRGAAIDATIGLLDDPAFLVQLAAISALEGLGDARALGALDRLARSAHDGRARRDAAEAAMTIREGLRVPAQVVHLREDIDRLREEQKKIAERIAALETP